MILLKDRILPLGPHSSPRLSKRPKLRSEEVTNSGPHSSPRLPKQSFEVQQSSDQRTLQIQDLILLFASPSNHLRSKAPIRGRYKFRTSFSSSPLQVII